MSSLKMKTIIHIYIDFYEIYRLQFISLYEIKLEQLLVCFIIEKNMPRACLLSLNRFNNIYLA